MKVLFRADSLLLFLGSSLLPIYVFGSGGVQPTHLLLALFMGLTFSARQIPLTTWTLALLAVFLYAFWVESVYVMLGGKPKFIIHSVFFLYNFLLAGAVYVHIRENGLSILVPGILIAATIALVTVLIAGVNLREFDESGRATSSFNNPNQLGYFSVCLLSLAYLFYLHKNIGYWVAAGIFAVALLLAISSLSKAAMVANFLVIFFALKPTVSRRAIFAWVASASAGALLIIQLYQSGAFEEFLFMERLANMTTEGDSSLASRGYFAFMEGNVLQIVFGLGAEGAHDIVGHEVHSTFGSIFNNYGMLGFAFFSLALAVWAKRLWESYGLIGLFCLAGPPMLYGITHNGIRFTIFWILYAASMAMACRDEAGALSGKMRFRSRIAP